MANPHLPLAAPSLLDKKSMGGIIAGKGLTAQGRYMASRISTWLANPRFLRFQSERIEDVDAWFADEQREHRQVKTETLRQGDVASLLSEFRTRSAELIDRGRLQRYVVVASRLGPELEKYVHQLENARLRHFEPSDAAERSATFATLAETAVDLRLDQHHEFILAYVDFDRTLAIYEGDLSETVAQLAAQLARLLGIRSYDEAEYVAHGLLADLNAEPYRSWSRSDLEALFQKLRTTFREGPPREAGDVIAICHQSLKNVDVQVEAHDGVELFAERRIVRVAIDQVSEVKPRSVEALNKAAHQLSSVDGPYLRALADPNGRVLYYGFPHVPFGMLAGFLAQPHRRIELVEHDLTTGRFAWSPLGAVGAVEVAKTEVDQRTRGRVARLRVSISAKVRESVCSRTLDESDVRLDLHVVAGDVARGTVTTDAQARQHAAQVRKILDAEIAGNPDIEALHIFAAVPVSVAFLIGQALAHSSIPPVYVYNFETTSRPPYAWRLGLRQAATGDDCIDMMEDRDGAA